MSDLAFPSSAFCLENDRGVVRFNVEYLFTDVGTKVIGDNRIKILKNTYVLDMNIQCDSQSSKAFRFFKTV